MDGRPIRVITGSGEKSLTSVAGQQAGRAPGQEGELRRAEVGSGCKTRETVKRDEDPALSATLPWSRRMPLEQARGAGNARSRY